MAYNGAGVYSLYTPGNPVVTATTISSTWANNTLNDIATALSTCMLKDGTQTLTANIPMSTFKLTGLGNGTAATDSMAYGQRMKVKVVSTTYDLTTASGSQTVTGIGFTPSAVFIMAGVNATSYVSWGISDGTTNVAVADNGAVSAGTHTVSGSVAVYNIQGVGVYQSATIGSFTSGQFIITWTKSGAPTGTAGIYCLVVGY